MATKKAVASGNWSDTATWDGGTLPISTDDVYPNTYTVVIDQDVTVASLRNAAATGISAGGNFTLNDGWTVTADLISNATIINFSAASPAESTIIGAISPNPVNHFCITHSGTGTLNIVGNITSTGGDGRGINVTGAGTVNLVGDINCGTSNGTMGIVCTTLACTINVTGDVTNTSTFNTTHGINGSTAGIVTVVGNVTAGANVSAYGITGGKTVDITGNLQGSVSSTAPALHCTTTSALVTVTGTVTAGASSYGLHCVGTTQYVFLTGPFISHNLGQFPLYVSRMFIIPNSSARLELRDDSTSGSLVTPANAYSLYTAAAAIDAPAPEDVREGVIYANATETGTLIVPDPSNVSLGVPTDDTVGTAFIDPEDIADALLDAIQTSSHDVAVRLKNCATVDSVGDQLAAAL